jgi:hypothetical protein
VLVVEPSGDVCGWSEVAHQMTGEKFPPSGLLSAKRLRWPG